MNITLDFALFTYASMFNTLDSSKLLLLLADDFTYSSQTVFTDLVGRDAYAEYINTKLLTLKSSSQPVFAELGELDAYGESKCIILAQGNKDNLVGLIYIKINSNNKITRADLCIVPPPNQATRTGVYPGMT